MRLTMENVPHLIKRSTLGKVRHTWKSAAHLEKMHHTWKNEAHLGKCGTLGKMRHTWKKTAHLEKWVTR